MQKILIKNFGPLEEVNLEVKDLMLFIGPQASGKSTISKGIFFFKSIRDDVLRYLLEGLDDGKYEKALGNIGKRIRGKFLEFWGPTAHLGRIFLQYDYGDGKGLSINLRGKYVNPTFSPNFMREFGRILTEVKRFARDLNTRDKKYMSSSEFLAVEVEKRKYYSRIQELVNNLFEDDKDLIFIPAGRSLLATLSDQLQSIHPHSIDYLMRSFIDRINNSKKVFNKSLDDLILEKKKLTYEEIDKEIVELAKEKIFSILKAKYLYDDEGEKLFVDDRTYTKINFASSGQQESIWILNLIFLNILNKKKVFVVFEEPEAHLYPEAQKAIVELITLLVNSEDNQVIITTHSPYVLSSFNNLIYAHFVGEEQEKFDQIDQLVTEFLWLDPDQVIAYKVARGHVASIMDDQERLIKTEEIDKASEVINETFEKIFNLDV